MVPVLFRKLVNVYSSVLEPAFQNHILASFYLLKLVSIKTPSLVGQRCELSTSHSCIKCSSSRLYPAFYQFKRCAWLDRVYYVGAAGSRKLVRAHHRCVVRSALERIICDLRPSRQRWSSYMLCHIKSKYILLLSPSCAISARGYDILDFVELGVYASQSASRLFSGVFSLLSCFQNLLVYVSIAANIISLLCLRAKSLHRLQYRWLTYFT